MQASRVLRLHQPYHLRCSLRCLHLAQGLYCSQMFKHIKFYTLIGTPPFQGARAHAPVWPAAVRYGVPLHPLFHLVGRLKLTPG